MDKCPYCGAETRQGDNFCLNCGNRLLPNTPPSPQQGQPVVGEAIAAASDDWGAANQGAVPVANNWSDGGNATVAESPGHDAPTMRDAAAAPVQTLDRIEQPARFILRSENGEVLQEYPLDKLEITIGRAPNSDILLSKDKLTSRRHATIRYENSKYWLHDEHSANGTFVNGQQIEDNAPYELKESDLVGIGEHELVFRAFGSQGGAGIEDLPTQAVPFNAPQPERTFRTLDDAMATQASSDDFGTHTIDTAEEQQEEQAEAPVTPPPTFTPVEEEPVVNEAPEASEEPVVNVAQPASSAQVSPPTVDKTVLGTATPSSDANVTFNRLTSVPQPTLPDISALMAALSTLDGQVMSLQEQINTTQESMRNHDAEIAQTAGQLRTGVRRVTERMDNTIADVARSREALAWAELLQLMEDVMNNPRDIEYVTKLARKARELNKVFQIHQNVLNTMAECNSLLRSLIGEDK